MKRTLLFALMLPVFVLGGCDRGGKTSEEPVNSQGVLINGVVWAITNVDAPEKFATKSEDFGMFYKWGNNVGWSATDPLVSSNGDTTWDGSTVSGEVWASFYDPCPDGWRVPDVNDFESLVDGSKVVSTWTKRDGVSGRLFVDVKTEKSIFLPAAGYRYYYLYDSTLHYQSFHGRYWSSTAAGGARGYALSFDGDEVDHVDLDNYADGYSVRCVRK
jgi:uncharacterized protein (TIGR02145 family)